MKPSEASSSCKLMKWIEPKRFMWKRWKLNWCTHLEFNTQTFSLLKICCTFYFLCFEQSCQFFTLDRNLFVGLWETTQFIFYLVRKVFLKKKTITNLFDIHKIVNWPKIWFFNLFFGFFNDTWSSKWKTWFFNNQDYLKISFGLHFNIIKNK